MSTQNTIFLTEDNEHCYTDCSLPVRDDKNYIGDELILEIDLKNCTFHQDESTLTVYFTNPKSEIYKKVESLKNTNVFK